MKKLVFVLAAVLLPLAPGETPVSERQELWIVDRFEGDRAVVERALHEVLTLPRALLPYAALIPAPPVAADLRRAVARFEPDVPPPERLLDALIAYQGTRSHEGRRRQMQFIGKLMRGVDVEPLREVAATAQIGHTRESLALHQAERWRAELIADDDALTRFAAEHEGADVQQLRSVIRNARKDAALVPEKRSGRYFRELFQIIRAQSASNRGTP